MSSIRRVQTERLLEDVVHTLYSEGSVPMFAEVSARISRYFSEHPAGLPLILPLVDAIAAGTSSATEYNRLLSHLAINLDVLYEVSMRQIEEVLDITTSMRKHIDRLDKYRNRLDARIDDFLLGLYNIEGYYHSISDNFADTSLVDIDMTTAVLDTDAGIVMLPSISNTSSVLRASLVSDPTITITGSESGELDYDELAPFTGALEDSLENIVWAFEVRTNTVQEVVAEAVVSIGNQNDPISLSRIDIRPYGATPVQVFFETRKQGRGQASETNEWQGFGNKIQTSTSKMVFGDQTTDATAVKITLRKTEPDYEERINGNIYHKYIFGARDITFTHRIYESSARVVSAPLFLPEEFSSEMVIDAVSVDVKENIPPDTSLKYYVAASDGGEEETFSSINWKEITPVGSNDVGEKSIRFDGAARITKRITDEPASGDLELLPLVSTGPLADRNPSSLIIPGVDTYRITQMQDADNLLVNTLELSEGVNTTKIYSKPIDVNLDFDDVDLEYWADTFNNNQSSLDIDYGRIDAGNEFFYGGDVGADGRDVFVETFLESDTTYPTFLDELQKVDQKSATWDVKVFLNGRSLGRLAPDIRKAQLPWRITRGKNHVVLLIRIPSSASAGVSQVFIGALALMSNSNLFDFGLVRLDKWHHVDMFTMKFNESGQPRTFTIHDGEIISRRQPTTNFQLKYAKANETSPTAIRFRADMSRERNAPNVSPELESYRIRFSYGEED